MMSTASHEEDTPMADILCVLCREPWDSYGITYDIGEGDMTREEVKQFKRGEGCPACKFGHDLTYVLPVEEQDPERALASLLDASDAEPMGMIMGWRGFA